jgi:hypothetical protein
MKDVFEKAYQALPDEDKKEIDFVAESLEKKMKIIRGRNNIGFGKKQALELVSTVAAFADMINYLDTLYNAGEAVIDLPECLAVDYEISDKRAHAIVEFWEKMPKISIPKNKKCEVRGTAAWLVGK